MGHDDDLGSIRAMAGLATPMSVRVAVTLGLPDRLRGDGASAGDLAAELDVAPVPLGLLLDHLVTIGIAERTPTGYRTTDFGASLCADRIDDLTNTLLRLDTAGGRAELAFVELAHSVATGRSAYTHRYGKDFWTDLAENPDLRDSFDRQMTYRLRGQVPQVVAGFDWSRFATVVDVGGGRGEMLAGILAANPGIHGHLVDLDRTTDDARRTFAEHGLADRVQVTTRSIFERLPAGADAYVLFDILHDWDDEHAGQILARCVEAARPEGRILVIEPVGGRHASSEINLSMLTMFGGRERRVDEFRALGSAHGLVMEQVVDLTDRRCLLEFRFAAPE